MNNDILNLSKRLQFYVALIILSAFMFYEAEVFYQQIIAVVLFSMTVLCGIFYEILLDD